MTLNLAYRSFKVINFRGSRMPVVDFTLAVNSNFLPSAVSVILCLLYANSHFWQTTPPFRLKFEDVPLGVAP